jgi:hypothetical protein
MKMEFGIQKEIVKSRVFLTDGVKKRTKCPVGRMGAQTQVEEPRSLWAYIMRRSRVKVNEFRECRRGSDWGNPYFLFPAIRFPITLLI